MRGTLLRRAERGYVLMGAVWLLSLATAITGALVLRGLTTSEAASRQERQFQSELALEAAIETVAADLLINGPRSQWWLLPHDDAISLDGGSVSVRVTNEAGRLDINDGALDTIDATLLGLGVASMAREEFVTRLKDLRADRHRVLSDPELGALLAQTGLNEDNLCIGKYLTHLSGLSRPRDGQMDTRLAAATGSTKGLEPAPPAAGDAIRIEATASGGQTLSVSIRITGDLKKPVIYLRRESMTCR